MLPLHTDLEQLDKIAKDLEILENRTEINWLRAIYDADELGKIKLKTSLLKQSKIELLLLLFLKRNIILMNVWTKQIMQNKNII